jgi:protein ImuB
MTERAVRVLALWSPELGRSPPPRTAAGVPPHQPAAVFVAGRVLACSAVARTQGVRRGLRRREAQARCPSWPSLAPDPDRDARAFEPVVVAVGGAGAGGGDPPPRPGGAARPRPGELVRRRADGGGAAGRPGRRPHRPWRCRRGSPMGCSPPCWPPVVRWRSRPATRPPSSPRSAWRSSTASPTSTAPPSSTSSAASGCSTWARSPRSTRPTSRPGSAPTPCSATGSPAGWIPRPAAAAPTAEELTVEAELDPPVDRVDAAAFAARGLAERLHATLAGHGLACTRLGVTAHNGRGGGAAPDLAVRGAAHPRRHGRPGALAARRLADQPAAHPGRRGGGAAAAGAGGDRGRRRAATRPVG